jgi:hypothetical protein
MLQENSSVILDKILIYARLEAALRREFKEKDHVVKKNPSGKHPDNSTALAGTLTSI